MSEIKPGLIILHGNQLELLRSAVFQWLRQNPLAPLEQETYLVQSNGVAEWLKIAVAEDSGICAATKIDLPGRFLWGVYRAMLGRVAMPSSSPLDKAPLTWRLMRLMPELSDQPVFAPLQRFLAGGDPERRLQLAQQVADILDQYQLYRSDWLQDWAEGRDQLRQASGHLVPLTEDQLWQAQLWRAILADIPEQQLSMGRVNIHQRFMQAIADGAQPESRLPRRVVLFGVSALPRQMLEALSALSEHTQVVLAVPNPCQYYWGDIIEGSALLKAQYKRQALKNGRDLSLILPEHLHAHSHPLLANWGRQGRDFVRMLDDFDNAQATREKFSSLRIDLFSDGEGQNLLQNVQAAVRDLLPLEQHPFAQMSEPEKSAARAAAHQAEGTDQDNSVVFHICHSRQREVEVLHDQLLAMFADTAVKPALRPRDVIVMVPDIEVFSPAIRSVFAQYPRQDARYIPFEIGDVKDRSINPVLLALEFLLNLPQQRCQQSQMRDLLDVPALASKFGILTQDLPQISQWIVGAGVRWGLDQTHRDGLGLTPAGEQNSWIFGIRRMLLGYASGADYSYAGIQAYPEVGGLSAVLAGSLAQFVDALIHWRSLLSEELSPSGWGVRARELLQAFFNAEDENDQQMLMRLDASLQAWLVSCADAQFDEAVPLGVLREAWLGSVDEQTLNHRFVSGGVTFCSLMPMRAVPFRVVCLLGMNDGDYPRRTQHVDFDLLAQAGMARPGDRSRRNDDRYLMLEALLAARDKLYISWVGRNIRDNTEQPASVLVTQLRDYLEAGWNCPLARLTTEHALQAFSRRYFEQHGLLTYAREWRTAHTESQTENLTAEQLQAQLESAGSIGSITPETLPAYQIEPGFTLKTGELLRFLRQPVQYFFRQRLSVIFNENASLGEDDEPFSLNGLEEYFLIDQLLEDDGAQEQLDQVEQKMRAKTEAMKREGSLAIGLVGTQWQNRFIAELVPVRQEWLKLCARYPMHAEKIPLSFNYDGIVFDDWLDKLYKNQTETVCLLQISSKVLDKKAQPRADKLLAGWLRQLLASASGEAITVYLLARDALIVMPPFEQSVAQQQLQTLTGWWYQGLQRILPTACKTALAFLAENKPYETYNGGFDNMPPAESNDPCLSRIWPDYAALSAEPEWEDCSRGIYQPLYDWAKSEIEVLKIQDCQNQEEVQ